MNIDRQVLQQCRQQVTAQITHLQGTLGFYQWQLNQIDNALGTAGGQRTQQTIEIPVVENSALTGAPGGSRGGSRNTPAQQRARRNNAQKARQAAMKQRGQGGNQRAMTAGGGQQQQ